jgi:hypothetical protein
MAVALQESTQSLGELLPTALLEMSVLLGTAVLVGLFAQRIRLPLTVVLAVAGVLATELGVDLALVGILSGEGFKQLLVNLFLPVLVFEAALTLSTREFMRNLVARRAGDGGTGDFGGAGGVRPGSGTCPADRCRPALRNPHLSHRPGCGGSGVPRAGSLSPTPHVGGR